MLFLSSVSVCRLEIHSNTTLTNFLSPELRQQIQEDDGLGPMLPRRELLTIMKDAQGWSEHSIKAGETNIKSHMFVCLLSTQIDCIRKRLPASEIPAQLVKAATEVETTALAIMEKMVEQTLPEHTVDELGRMSLDSAAEVFEGWDFMVSG
jgi:hypothetical protein